MISYKLSKDGIGKLNVTRSYDQITFGYPCEDSPINCSPYTVNLSPGSYRIEAWGSAGNYQRVDPTNSVTGGTPGLGGYTSGILNLNKQLTLYLFIGSISPYNNIYNYSSRAGSIGGGSSDVRLSVNATFDWYDAKSLRSRIMVAGGGGGAEWNMSIGGNGGGLEGDSGISQCNSAGPCSTTVSNGGSQTKGGSTASASWKHVDGAFGFVKFVDNSTDMGGYGGNGYFSGGSLDYAGAGGGGSSFVSGYEGCIALAGADSDTASPTNSSIHYSGNYFESPSIQRGNSSMPLYYNKLAHGIGNKGRGSIRITIMSYKLTCHSCRYFNYQLLTYVFVLIYDS